MDRCVAPVQGDIMLYAAEHVVIFGGWADSAKTKYTAYQEPGCHTDGPHHAFKYGRVCVGGGVMALSCRPPIACSLRVVCECVLP